MEAAKHASPHLCGDINFDITHKKGVLPSRRFRALIGATTRTMAGSMSPYSMVATKRPGTVDLQGITAKSTMTADFVAGSLSVGERGATV